jgi:XTP/dITP diphosphohydrolase
MQRLLLATRNEHKLRELRAKLAPLGVEVLGLRGLAGVPDDVEETGQTFRANARLKALAYGRAAGLPALADDSGIEVDALGGAPGIYSARYAGPGCTDEDNNRKLLAAMDSVPWTLRTARFRCALALYLPASDEAVRLAGSAARHPAFEVEGPEDLGDHVILTEAATEGHLLEERSGEGGFGYDPIFFSDDLQCSFGEAGERKHAVSHRARALQSLIDLLTANEPR